MANQADRAAAERRARTRLALIVAGLSDLALAGLFLGWGASVFGLDYNLAWLIAALLAAAGVVTLFIATLVFGRRGTEAALDEGEDDGPVIRR